MNQYATRLQAAAYFQLRLNTGAWDSASVEDQNKALSHATLLIDNLNYAGEKADPNQTNEFPRGIDASVPQAIVNACAEIALSLLDGVDVNAEGDNVNVTHQTLSTARTMRDTSFVPEWILAGIPSLAAWNLLRPFLRDPLALTLSRVN